VWLTHLWGKENPPFMQLLHFAFGVGAFISPFIAEPFLIPSAEQVVTNEINPMTFEYSTDVQTGNTTHSFWDKSHELLKALQSVTEDGHMIVANESSGALPPFEAQLVPEYDRSLLRVHWAYAIVSIYNVIVLIIYLTVYFINRSNEPHPSRLAAIQQQSSSEFASNGDSLKQSHSTLPNCTPSFPARRRVLVIILSTLFMHVYCGLEISFGALLATFTVKSKLQMSKSLSSFITSLYWGAFTFFRILTMVAITHCKLRTLLLVNMAIIMASNVLLLPFGDTCLWALWAGVALMGLGCSSVFATMIGYVEQMFPVTSRITSGFMTFACLGEFILPYIVGLFIETNPRVYLYVVFSYSVASCVFLFAIIFVQVKTNRSAEMNLKSSSVAKVQD
jgi:FHS family Na+ dependent glucose MFS transporter 1